jgi:hypothetical protein
MKQHDQFPQRARERRRSSLLQRISAYTDSWVMRSDEGGFTPLPGEQRIYTSPPRTAFLLQTLDKTTGRDGYSLSSGAGVVHLTNRRVSLGCLTLPAPADSRPCRWSICPRSRLPRSSPLRLRS